MKKFRSMVRAAMGNTHTHRYRALNVTIPMNATTSFGLLIADDEPDYDVDGVPGTTTPECPVKSKIVDVDLHFIFKPAGTGFGSTLECMIVRDEDNAGTITDITDLFDMDKSTGSLAARKNTLKFWPIVASTFTDHIFKGVRIRRMALKRAGTLADLDRLELMIKNNNATTDATFSVWGTITTRHD